MEAGLLFITQLCLVSLFGWSTVADLNSFGCHANSNETCTKVECSGISLQNPICEQIPCNCSGIRELHLTNSYGATLKPKVFANLTNLHMLNLIGNQIEKLQNDSFIGLELLHKLTIQSNANRNGILWIEQGTFKHLTSLELLDLSRTRTDVVSLFSAFCGISKKLSTLILNGIHPKSKTTTPIQLDKRLLECLKNKKVVTFEADNNDIFNADYRFLITFEHKTLQKLSLNRNILTAHGNGDILPFVASNHNLTYIDFSCQVLRECNDNIPRSISKWFPYSPEESSDESHSLLSSKETLPENTISMEFFPKLESIRAQYTNTELHFFKFCWLNNKLKYLDISYTSVINVRAPVLCMDHLKFLNLRGIRNLTLCTESFSGMPNLEFLMLGSASVPFGMFSQNKSSGYFDNNTKLKLLDLSDLLLKYNDINEELFTPLKHLEVLLLHKNKLTETGRLLDNMSSIVHIDLSSNMLYSIPYNFIESMARNGRSKSVKLNGNPFLCFCSDMKNLRSMLKMAGNMIIYVNDTVYGPMCTLPNRNRESFHGALEMLEGTCESFKVALFAAYALYVVTILMTVISTVISGFRWKLRLAWLKVKYRFLGEKMRFQEMNGIHKFDAYIAHAYNDLHWVKMNIMIKLEQADNHYNFCIAERNFRAGGYHVENILAAIRSSRKTVLVLTRKYARSKWCEFIISAAPAYHMENANAGVIAIIFPGFKGQLENRPGLCDLLNEMTYFECPPNDPDAKAVFLYKLKECLGKPIKPYSEPFSILNLEI